MAVMRKEQKEIDRLGPVGIIREAFKLLSSYFKFFMTIQLTFLLPLAALGTLPTEYVLHLTVNLGGPPATARAPHLLSNSGASFPGGTPGLHLGVASGFAIGGLLLVSAVFTIFMVALVSLASAANIYAVGLHYTGQRVSFNDVVRATRAPLVDAPDFACYRAPLVCGMLITRLVGSLHLLHYHTALPLLLLGVAALEILSIIGSVYLEITFLLAAGVAVLENDYGWAAVRRTPKLLKGRVGVALLFQLPFIVLSVLVLGLEHAFQSQSIAKGDYSPASVTAFVIITVLYISCTSFLWQLRAVCAGVLYVSFKAYHNEDLAESVSEKAIEVEYECVGSGTNDAKLGGQKAISRLGSFHSLQLVVNLPPTSSDSSLLTVQVSRRKVYSH